MKMFDFIKNIFKNTPEQLPLTEFGNDDKKYMKNEDIPELAEHCISFNCGWNKKLKGFNLMCSTKITEISQ